MKPSAAEATVARQTRATPGNATSSFARLTWNDLEKWAGSRIVSRGRSYQRSGRVQDLSLAPDGALLAWVQGSRRYATQVSLKGARNSAPSAPAPTGAPANTPWPWC